MHSKYLMNMGYRTPEEYCNHIETHPDSMDSLVILLTAMLNQVHVCVHSAEGMWHTHIKTQPCVCSLHMAAMGNNTFIALQKIPRSGEKLQTATASTTTKALAKPSVEPQKATASTTTKDPAKQGSDILRWVHCHSLVYPPSCSDKLKNRVFRSTAQITERKAEQDKDNTAKHTLPPRKVKEHQAKNNRKCQGQNRV